MIVVVAVLVLLLQLVSAVTRRSLVGILRSGSGQQQDKVAPFECGLEPFGEAMVKFEVLFYLVGLLYLIFDLEIVLLFPLVACCASLWSVLNPFSFMVVLFFAILLTLAFLYEWFTGALDFQEMIY